MSTSNDDTAGTRSIRLEIEVPGTPDQVWEAIATGPGITAWFVPAKVEGREGGVIDLDFGPGLGIDRARITAWDPPHRFVGLAEREGRPAFACEWLVEARDGGTCVVRLVNSGFGSGSEWDGEYDATQAGWRLFLYNLRLYLTHFPGQRCSSILINGMSTGPVAKAFDALTAAVGLEAGAREGQRVAATAADTPPLAGVVERATDGMLTLLLDEPAPGVAFLFAETTGGEHVYTSFYAYLFGDRAAEAAARDEPAWRAWMARQFPMVEAAPAEEAQAGP
jgi:uncharacterized protein YndB with AHSA1/START domain